MKIACYAPDRGQRLHRILSAIACAAIVAAVFSQWGFASAVRSLMVFAPATAGIWFAEAFVRETPSRLHSPVHFPYGPGLVRLVCWFVLCGTPAAVLLFHSLRPD